ncbi:DUF421 domain-containing protein [Planctomicrobium sp. SH664]|uniref:DUF421 domain-containing protein n=1 Tax=Planctomicrobium sp. SH664 TaxID=3448125 RepID=UPI003F5B0058
MPGWLNLDWSGMFVPSVSPLEIFIRGTCTYLALFLFLRAFRRQTAAIGPADLLVIILIADAAQNAMSADYKSITDGLILIATIIFWEYVLDVMAFHVPFARPLIERPPLLVVEDGKIHPQNLASELMTEADLLSQLRLKGVSDIQSVRQAYIEGDGHVSVITDGRSTPRQAPQPDPQTGG